MSDDERYSDLIVQRGAGRYFGGEEFVAEQATSGRLCHRCKQPGHKAADCKVTVCSRCLEIGSHETNNCPKRRCNLCGKTGHKERRCKVKDPNKYCERCRSFSHFSHLCPSLWRTYELAESKDAKVTYPSSITCYNCGEIDHYGDECKKERFGYARHQEHSAFTGNNLPEALKDRYFKEIANTTARSSYRERGRGGGTGGRFGMNRFRGRDDNKFGRQDQGREFSSTIFDAAKKGIKKGGAKIKGAFEKKNRAQKNKATAAGLELSKRIG